VIKVPKVPQKRKTERPSFFQEFGAGLKAIRMVKGMIPLILMAMSLNFLLVPLSTLLPTFIIDVHLGRELDLAFVMAALQGGIMGGSALMMIKKTIKRKDIVILTGLYAVFVGYAIVALPPTGDFLMMAVGMVIIGIAVPIVNIIFMTTTQSVIPLDMQGRVGGVLRAISSAISPIGMIFGGIVGIYFGLVPLFLLCVVLGILVISVTWVTTDVQKVVDIPPQQPTTQSPQDEHLIIEKKEEEE
jgi:Na+/melibiose symporter-like transporter